MGSTFEGSTFKMVRLIGEAEGGIEDAVKTALKTSAETVRGQTWIQVSDIRANVNEDGGIDRWQVTVDVAFKVER